MSGPYTYRPPLGIDIRVKPLRKGRVEQESHACAWPRCQTKAHYRAPKTSDSDDFQWFCLDHVRAFNKSWNFFKGMSDSEVQRFVEGNLTGHRPTWQMQDGSNSPKWTKAMRASAAAAGLNKDATGSQFQDFFRLFGEIGGTQKPLKQKPVRALTRSQVKALQTLDLEKSASRDQIKARYKELVKRYHPDANGGDTAAVERLRSVIRAYQTLKSSGIGKEQPAPAR